MRRLCLLLLMLSSTSTFAEAGLPFGFCRETTCACGATTCACGEVCNLSLGTCLATQAFFCGGDPGCAASCGSFICELNVCVRGARPDAGVPDAGGLDGGPPDGGARDGGPRPDGPDTGRLDGGGVDGGPGPGSPGTGCGCGPGEGGVLAVAALALLVFGHRRAPGGASRS